jgi:hypothetical protein
VSEFPESPSELADEELIYGLLALTVIVDSPAARTDVVASTIRSLFGEVCRRWLPADAVATALRQFGGSDDDAADLTCDTEHSHGR